MPRSKPLVPRKARSVLLPEEFWDAIEAEAVRNERSVTGQVRLMLIEWLKAHGSLPDTPPTEPKRPR